MDENRRWIFSRRGGVCLSWFQLWVELVMICKSCLRWDFIHGFREDLLDPLILRSYIASSWCPFCLSWGHSSRRRFNSQEARLRKPVRSGIPTLKSSILFLFSFLGFSPFHYYEHASYGASKSNFPELDNIWAFSSWAIN